MASASNVGLAEMTHLVTIETTDSDSSSESVKLVDYEIAAPAPSPKLAEDYASMSIWREPFDYRILPQSISLELIKRCPFVVGSDRARYPASFFAATAGLCARGLDWQALKSDELFPLDDLRGTYPTSKKGNRHPLKLIRDKQTAIDALHMYRRVYGYSQPHNGEFGTSFIRCLALFYQRDQNVNWAAKAAQLAEDRVKRHPQKKLTPPSIREQIQAMINLFSHYLKDAYMRVGCTCKVGSDTPRVLTPPLLGAAGLQRRRSCNPVRKTDVPVVEPSPSTICQVNPSAIQAQIQHKEAEGRLIQLQQKEKLEILWTKQQLSMYQAHAVAEQESLDQQVELSQLAKAIKVDDIAEKACFHDIVRAKTHEANVAFAAVEEIVNVLLTKSKTNLQGCAVILEELTLELERMKAGVEVVVAKNNNICLQVKRSMDDALTSASLAQTKRQRADSHPVDARVYGKDD